MRFHAPSHTLSREEGSAMVEFAITASLLFILLFGVMELCWALYSYEAVNTCAREAARYAIVHGSGCAPPNSAACFDDANTTTLTENTSLETYVHSLSYPGLNSSTVTVYTLNTFAPGATACVSTNCAGAGDQVTVKVQYPFTLAVPFLKSRPINMVGSSTMVISQ